MSDWPQLEQELLRSSRRRYRRRARTWRRVRPVVLVPLVIALALVAITTMSRHDAGVPGDEQPIATSTPAKSSKLESAFAIFRRPRTARDDLGYNAEQLRQLQHACRTGRGGLCIVPDSARLAVSSGPTEVFLARGGNVGTGLCMLVRFDSKGAGASCTSVKSAASPATPMGTYGAPRNGKPGTALTAFPDSVTRVAYTLADGTIVVREVHDNVAYMATKAAVTSLSWTVNGHRYVNPISDPDPGEQPTQRGCPSLDVPPADANAAAAAAALAAAPSLYHAAPKDLHATGARVAQPGDLTGARRMACGDDVASRSILVELTIRGHADGAVLVGFRNDDAFVWTQLR